MKQHEIQLGLAPNGGSLLLPGTESVAVLARSRTGKTSSFCIPNAFLWPGSLVVLDIRREVFRATAGHRAAMGQDVYLLDPAAEDGRSHRWNPLAIVDRLSEDRFDQISRIAFMLFPEGEATNGSSGSSERFWEPAARAAYTAITTIVAETPQLPLDMPTVLRLFARGDGVDIVIDLIRKRRAGGGRQYSQDAVDGVSDYVSGHSEMVQGIRKSLTTRLQSFWNHRVAAATRVSDFDLRDLRRRPMTIYVGVSPGNMVRMRPYLALFFEQLVNLNVDKTPEEDPTIQHQALVILDEFSRLGKLPTVAEAAQFISGYGMRFAFVVQNKAQLQARYGDASAIDIFDNMGAEIVFGTNDLATCKEVSERFGDDTAIAMTNQQPRWMGALQIAKQTEATHLHRRPAMLPQEIARMRNDEQIVLRAGMPPMHIKRQGWFNDPDLRRLVREPPPIPHLNWHVAEDDGKTRVERQEPRKQDAT